MRYPIILVACAFIGAGSLVTRVEHNSTEVRRASTSATLQPQASPTPPEWDPAREGIGDLDEGPRTEVAPAQRRPITVVGQRFTPSEFAVYVKNQVVPEINRTGHWRPSFIVLHHTGVPSISQRPQGFTGANMQGLSRYYGVDQGWRSGPHLFIDQNGIWVFTALTRQGTHSPSWNRVAWGIEQLGNFINEDYQTGEGAKIRDNAVAAIAILSVARGLAAETLRFHLEDTHTTHKHCPGETCKKPDVLVRVRSEIVNWRSRWNSL